MANLVGFTLLGLAVGVPGIASADDVGYQLETSVASSYVVRGIPQYATRGVPSSQSSASVHVDHVGDGTVMFGVWNAVAMEDYDTQPGTALEVDVSVAYAVRAGALSLTTGYGANLFPSHMHDTPVDGAHELSAVVSYDTPYVVPAAAAYVEFVHQQGVYLQLGASRDLPHAAWTFSPALSVGGATYRKYAGGDRAATPHLNDVTAAVTVRRELDAGVYASAKLSYSLCGTPSDLMPMESWGFDGRSTMYGVVAVGVAR